ncbi:glycoside hydrolase family 3 protein [Allostreptomyces psammosilenae]|uniref:glycoside hydrolase family 3 protein n=1 Tax=Allostreptomyces psammosilenae TaxID=1892865 RepID=UPI0015C97BB0|nr:glycoside hydrolase family 3 protein [Allostreptomyces psammosilenae]
MATLPETIGDEIPPTVARDALTVLQPGFVGTEAPEWLLRAVAGGLGSVGLFGRNVAGPRQLARLTAQLRAVRPDLLVAIDEEGGDVTRLDVADGSAWPGNHALGAADDVELTRRVARELGRSLIRCGINHNWAPSADINSDPDNPVIGVRSFGADPALAARHTVAYVEGVQSVGVAATVKHFPGHGDTATDSHLGLPEITVDAATLRAREFEPFRAAIAAGVKSVMSAHIMVPALDPDLPATLSRRILTGVLRDELGFDGVVVTDGIEMGAIAHRWGIARGAVLALAAGADAVCVGGGLADEATVVRLRDAIALAVASGELPAHRLAEAAGRVRALGRWTQEALFRALPEPDTSVGLDAARRALRITRNGDFTPIGDAELVHVVEFSPVANIAVGDQTPWGVGSALAAALDGAGDGRRPRVRIRRLGAADLGAADLDGAALDGADAGAGNTGVGNAAEEAVRRVLADSADRRIVLVVRDVHRYEWMRHAVSRLVAERPDAVVVEMGVPQARPAGALHIATHGAARCCGIAAAEILTGRTLG